MRFPYLDIYEATSEKLIKEELPFRLKSAGYTQFQTGNNFLYAIGQIPVMLVAHVDTVHFNKKPDVFFDSRKAVLYSTDGCGGDDRAGISGILEILRLGFRPYILFTDLEEKGCVGAREAADAITTIPDIRYAIELDRKNAVDSCFYQCDNPAFETYVNFYGFKTAFGTFTDICNVCPKWGIAGVNLSVGYYGAHTTGEIVKLIEWHDTVMKVTKMLRSVPKRAFKYIPKVYTNNYNYGRRWNKYTNSWDDYGSDDYWDKDWQDRLNKSAEEREKNKTALATTNNQAAATAQTPGEKTLAEKNAAAAAATTSRPVSSALNEAITQQATDKINKNLEVGLDKKIEKILDKMEQRPVFKSAAESAKVLESAPTDGKEIAVVDLPSDGPKTLADVAAKVKPQHFNELHESIENELESEFFSRDFRFELYPDDLAAEYGGSVEDWAAWIDNNIEVLDELIREQSEIAIHKYLTEHVNDILSIIAKDIIVG